MLVVTDNGEEMWRQPVPPVHAHVSNRCHQPSRDSTNQFAGGVITSFCKLIVEESLVRRDQATLVCIWNDPRTQEEKESLSQLCGYAKTHHLGRIWRDEDLSRELDKKFVHTLDRRNSPSPAVAGYWVEEHRMGAAGFAKNRKELEGALALAALIGVASFSRGKYYKEIKFHSKIWQQEFNGIVQKIQQVQEQFSSSSSSFPHKKTTSEEIPWCPPPPSPPPASSSPAISSDSGIPPPPPGDPPPRWQPAPPPGNPPPASSSPAISSDSGNPPPPPGDPPPRRQPAPGDPPPGDPRGPPPPPPCPPPGSEGDVLMVWKMRQIVDVAGQTCALWQRVPALPLV